MMSDWDDKEDEEDKEQMIHPIFSSVDIEHWCVLPHAEDMILDWIQDIVEQQHTLYLTDSDFLPAVWVLLETKTVYFDIHGFFEVGYSGLNASEVIASILIDRGDFPIAVLTGTIGTSVILDEDEDFDGSIQDHPNAKRVVLFLLESSYGCKEMSCDVIGDGFVLGEWQDIDKLSGSAVGIKEAFAEAIDEAEEGVDDG